MKLIAEMADSEAQEHSMGNKTHTISTPSSYNSFAVPASIIQTEPFIECKLKYTTPTEAKTKVARHKEIVDGLN